MRLRLILFSLIFPFHALPADGLSRGPYLQMPSPDAITVCWQTGEATDGIVRYGMKPGELGETARTAGSGREHEVRLTGLEPSTTYYYSVGSSEKVMSGGTADFQFKTAPKPGSATPVRVWVLGDSGTGGDGTGRAEKVRDSYLNSPHFKIPDLWLMLGDNAYPDNTEEQLTRAVFGTYPKMLASSPLWSTYGNHDTATDRGAPYFNAFRFPTKGECGGQPSGTERFYSFDYANIHFVCLDSEGDRRADSPMFKWLEADLAANDKTWLIAFWHLPPYSKGSHDSDTERALVEMRSNALPILEKHGADLVLGGHSHSYERSMLINGHYGSSAEFDVATMAVNHFNGRPESEGAYRKKPGAEKGTVYVVGGNSGKISGGKLNHPVMKVSENRLGSILLDIEGGRLQLRALGADGEVFDSFTITKE
jgi:acid phosphatase type 7